MRAGGGRRAPALVVGGAVLLTGCLHGAAPAAAPAQPPTEGAGAAPTAVVSYTEGQAERGREVFDTVCSACHAAGEFRGQMFRMTWMTRPIGHFFQHISAAMPQDRPGSLSPDQYASVVAYALQLNGHPAGSRELPSDVRVLEALPWPP